MWKSKSLAFNATTGTTHEHVLDITHPLLLDWVSAGVFPLVLYSLNHWMFLIHSCSVLQHISVRNENHCGLGLWTHAKHTAASMGLRGLEIGRFGIKAWNTAIEWSPNLVGKTSIFLRVKQVKHAICHWPDSPNHRQTSYGPCRNFDDNWTCGNFMTGMLEGRTQVFSWKKTHWIPCKGIRKEHRASAMSPN